MRGRIVTNCAFQKLQQVAACVYDLPRVNVADVFTVYGPVTDRNDVQKRCPKIFAEHLPRHEFTNDVAKGRRTFSNCSV
jgi:hypothetical protein